LGAIGSAVFAFIWYIPTHRQAKYIYIDKVTLKKASNSKENDIVRKLQVLFALYKNKHKKPIFMFKAQLSPSI